MVEKKQLTPAPIRPKRNDRNFFDLWWNGKLNCCSLGLAELQIRLCSGGVDIC